MYCCKEDVLRKLVEVRHLHSTLDRYRGKVFVRNGLDDKTGIYPVGMALSAFIVHARTIFQYAYKQADETGRTRAYEGFVTSRPIIQSFRDMRDTEIHERVLDTRTEIAAESRLLRPDEAPWDTSSEEPREAKVTITLTRRLNIDQKLIGTLEEQGHHELAAAARNGKSLYEELVVNGKRDVFQLCDDYLDAIEEFVELGIREGFIS
jgi:hypothetical protein